MTGCCIHVVACAWDNRVLVNYVRCISVWWARVCVSDSQYAPTGKKTCAFYGIVQHGDHDIVDIVCVGAYWAYCWLPLVCMQSVNLLLVASLHDPVFLMYLQSFHTSQSSYLKKQESKSTPVSAHPTTCPALVPEEVLGAVKSRVLNDALGVLVEELEFGALLHPQDLFLIREPVHHILCDGWVQSHGNPSFRADIHFTVMGSEDWFKLSRPVLWPAFGWGPRYCLWDHVRQTGCQEIRRPGWIRAVITTMCSTKAWLSSVRTWLSLSDGDGFVGDGFVTFV